LTVLVEGETGTGQAGVGPGHPQLDAKRSNLPFITVYCGTSNEALAESELFGHTKGAFSGAVSDRKGLFPSAHLGTLFLDDVNDLPVYRQAKLLDVISGASCGRLAPTRRKRSTFASSQPLTNQPLKPLVQQNRFRGDSYHRLNVVRLVLPPLRSRLRDLPELILALARRHRDLYEPIEQVEPELLRYLETQPFLGNIRGLENAVQRMLFSKTGGRSLGIADWMA
jgi:transcriptional regulator with GAF, ATPase, and Fis domain